jgi:Tol biopolymer transport system component
MNADGGEQRRLSSSPATSQARPVWSPDGRWLALVARRFGGFDDTRCDWIQLVDLAGNEPRRVTRCPGLDADNPSWALPD